MPIRTSGGRAGRTSSWSNRVVAVASLLVGVSVAHVCEDFVYGVPQKFGIDVAPAAVLTGVVYAVHAVLIALAARGQSVGYVGNLAAGVGWFLAAALDHLGEVLFDSPYRAGFVSKALEVGIMLAGLALAGVSFLAWWQGGKLRGH